MTLYLVDLLPSCEVESPGSDYVQVQPMTVDLDRRTALFQHPDSRVRFPTLRVGQSATFVAALGLKTACLDRIEGPVRFEVRVQAEGAGPTTLLDRTLDPRRNPADRRWCEVSLDLGSLAERPFRLELSTSVPRGGSNAWCWAGWAEPRLTDPIRPARPHRARRRHHDVLLVSSDALRADALGCYGGPADATPNLDALAAAGIRCSHARSPSSSTLATYGSMLTGRHPSQHGILWEWGRLAPGMLSLPAFLEGHGYHTLAACSEREIGDPEAGLSECFRESLPPLGTPFQPGDVSVRRLLERLEDAPDRPTFTWLQFFDTHPPSLAPRALRDRFYPGDPRDPARSWLPEKVARVHGVESMVTLDEVDALRSLGLPSADFRDRLRATGRALLGGRGAWPDLAQHLRSAPPNVRRGLPDRELGRWLLAKAEGYARNQADPELDAWLCELRPFLRGIELEILTWLEGVVDFRYPVSQYRADVSYLDSHVGTLLAGLDRLGRRETTTLVFCSPHGEMLDDHGIVFHHHTTLEVSLRIPLIIVPAAHLEVAPRGAPEGVFDLLDLFPTLAEALGLVPPPGLEGTSRWPQLRTGAPIPAHDSFSTGTAGSLACLVAGDRKLIRAWGNHRMSASWLWKAGDQALLDLADQRLPVGQEPEVLAALGARLEAWAARVGLPPWPPGA